MWLVDGIKFNSEGGFTLPNGQKIPVEQAKKLHVTFVRMATMFSSIGNEVEDDRTAIWESAISERKWSSIDSGNLQRIAEAAEGISNLLMSLCRVLVPVMGAFADVLEEPVAVIRERKKMEAAEKKAARKRKKS
jgi:hypothetical protein